MEINKNALNIIFEDESSSDSNIVDKVYVEITYFSDSISSIKSYYIMSQSEYRDLKTLYMDLYLDNFINNEVLTQNNIDIHIINNPNNIKLCKDILKVFGNPFDILSLIKEKKKIFDADQKIKINTKTYISKSNNKLLNDNFSDTSNDNNNNDNDNDNDKYDKEHDFDNILDQELSEPIIKPSKKNIDISLYSDTETESEDYIATMTEIIGTYNKTKHIDEIKLKKLTENKPEMLYDNIISEITKQKKLNKIN